MKTNNKQIIITAVILSITIIAWSFTTIHGGERTYEVRPEIEIPAYRSDSTRMIEAYERLMERYMDMVEKNLVSIEKKLDELSARTARIEKALVIETPQDPINNQNNTEKSK